MCGRIMRFVPLAAALVLHAVAPTATGATPKCSTPNATGEPPCNAYLPDSPWGASHRGSYAQASSPYPGLRSANVRTRHVDLPGTPIQIEFSNRYRDGGRAAWGSLIEAQDRRAVFKLDVRTGRLIDVYVPAEREAAPPPSEGGGITGAYNILDRDGRFIVPRQRSIDVFADRRRGLSDVWCDATGAGSHRGGEMTTFTVETIDRQPAAVVRAEVPMHEIRTVFDRGFAEVMRVARAQGVAITGPPFGFYPRMPTDTVEVAVGFPVSAAVTPDGEVIPFELPGGRVVVGIHVGSYESLEASYRELTEWATAEGHRLAAHVWESYLTDPRAEPDPAAWQTRITWPLA